MNKTKQIKLQTMKRQSIKGLALGAATLTLVASCDLLKDVDYKVTPAPLEMHADSVRVNLDATLPKKGIKKKVSATITPRLASTDMKELTIQGEKATGNGNVIQYKPGGKVTYTDVVAYKADMEVSELSVTGVVKKGSKVKTKQAIEKTVIGQGVIITPYLVNKNFRVIMEKDAFQRVTEQGTMGQINYAKGKSNVVAAEMKQKDILDLKAWMMAAQTNPKIAIKAINITGFASPEGEVAENNTLSSDRAASAKTEIMALAKAAKNEMAQTEIYTTTGSGEDFDGFKVEVTKSTMPEDERNLVLRVLQTYTDPAQRETEMRNMAKTFTYLEKNILPLLRRAEVKVVYDLTGYSDEELIALSKTSVDKLTLEEILFTANLVTEISEKGRLYDEAMRLFPEDHRAFNNAGGVKYMMNDMVGAKTLFEKADQMQANSIAKNNLGAIAGVAGDRAKAKQLLASAKGAGSEVTYNQGIINIQDAKYADAVTNLGTEATYNRALAQLLNGDAAAAIKTLDASTDKESAQGFYLKAVCSAHLDKVDAVVSNLKSAFGKDASLKAKAKRDREFYKFEKDGTFTSAIM